MDYVILEKCDEDHWILVSTVNPCADVDVIALICWA